MNYLYISPVFPEETKPIIKTGLKAFFEKNYVVAIHLLIPQIENSLRNLSQLIGSPIYKPHRQGGLLLKNFEELIRDEKIKEILGEDIVLYLRVLFTDQRGWNVRNIVCHGMAPLSAFDQPVADRIFHTLLLLSLIQKQESSDT